MGLPGEVERVVSRYLALADDAVPGLVEGLYLVGSVALDDFRPGVSDVDFIVVSSAPPDERSAQALSAVHARLAAEPGLPAFEGIYATFAELSHSPAESGGGLRMHGGKLTAGPKGRSPVEWTTLARHGMTVCGPAAADLDVHTDRGELTAWTLDNLDRYWSRWVAQGRRLASRTALTAWNLGNLDTFWRRVARQVRAMPPQAAAAYQARHAAWMVLGPPRLHYTIATGRLTSRSGAGAYAIASFPSRWHTLVSDALAIHHQQAASFTDTSTSAVQAAIADFIDFVITDARKNAEGGGRAWHACFP